MFSSPLLPPPSPLLSFFLSLKGKEDSIKCLRLFRWYWLAGFIHCIGTNQDCKMTLFLLLFAQRFASEKLVWTCQLTFFFNNLHCLDEMQRQFLEVVQEPRTCPSLTKCWEPPKPPGTSSLSRLSEIPLQGRNTLENRLKDFKIKGCSWDPSRRESAAAVHWEEPRTWLFTLVRQADDLLRMGDSFTWDGKTPLVLLTGWTKPQLCKYRFPAFYHLGVSWDRCWVHVWPLPVAAITPSPPCHCGLQKWTVWPFCTTSSLCVSPLQGISASNPSKWAWQTPALPMSLKAWCWFRWCSLHYLCPRNGWKRQGSH